MKPIRIKSRKNPHQESLIDRTDSLHNWALDHPDFTKYRFFEEDADRFITVPRETNPNRVENANKLVLAVIDHFKRVERVH